MSDFHNSSLKKAWLRLCQITNESGESENIYPRLNGVALAVELSIS